MNPYDFVRIDWEKGVQRRAPAAHDRFDGLSGRLFGTITTLKPLFIPEPRTSVPYPLRYIFNGQGQAIIPGSSLKGMVRSLVETIGYGCWWLFGGSYEGVNYHKRLPEAFRQCPDKEGRLCVACRMFGLIQHGKNVLLQGHVGFEDAVCEEPVESGALYTIILGTPKPRHEAFYLDEEKQHLAGRKYYFHQAQPPIDVGKWLPEGAPYQKQAQNNYIKPISAGNAFTFSAFFDNLAESELQLLLYALVLEPAMRHQIGYAKPAGLGSIELQLTQLELVDYTRRYGAADGGRRVYEGEELDRYVQAQIAPYTEDDASITLQDLRRIWAWPGRDDIAYPSWDWFQDAENAQKRLSET